MTSKEIEATPAINLSDKSWLKEVAFQLALLNEKAVADKTAITKYKHMPLPGVDNSLTKKQQKQIERDVLELAK